MRRGPADRGAGYATVPGGFPFTEASIRLPHTPEPIVAASARVARDAA